MLGRHSSSGRGGDRRPSSYDLRSALPGEIDYELRALRLALSRFSMFGSAFLDENGERHVVFTEYGTVVTLEASSHIALRCRECDVQRVVHSFKDGKVNGSAGACIACGSVAWRYETEAR